MGNQRSRKSLQELGAQFSRTAETAATENWMLACTCWRTGASPVSST